MSRTRTLLNSSLRLARPFSTSLPSYNTPASPSPAQSSSSSSSKDPNHPNLWYHPVSTLPPRIALSFLPSPPVYGSRTVLGYLPADAPSSLRDFKEEPRFLSLVHAAIKSGLERGVAETVDFEASARPGDGYIHITDERAIPPAGRIGETEDLIGSVFVQDGKVVPSTYEPLPSYRLLTGDGPIVLPRGLDKHLVEQLKEIDAEEQKQA